MNNYPKPTAEATHRRFLEALFAGDMPVKWLKDMSEKGIPCWTCSRNHLYIPPSEKTIERIAPAFHRAVDDSDWVIVLAFIICGSCANNVRVYNRNVQRDSQDLRGISHLSADEQAQILKVYDEETAKAIIRSKGQ